MPKRYILQSLLIAYLAVLLCSTIGMAKVIDVDTVWSGEVHVREKIIVDGVATLQVLPGARVTFDPIPEGASKGGGRLIVFGRLIAQGHPDKPIVFTSAAANPQANDWEPQPNCRRARSDVGLAASGRHDHASASTHFAESFVHT